MLKTNLNKKVASTLLVAGLVASVGGMVTQAAFEQWTYSISFDAYYGDEYSYSLPIRKMMIHRAMFILVVPATVLFLHAGI